MFCLKSISFHHVCKYRTVTHDVCQVLNHFDSYFAPSIKKASICFVQGFVEDQFGLGLIARAVEEGISIIKPLGIMIFNMGGRPGQAVCKRLFERRGLQVDKLWQTKVLQVLLQLTINMPFSYSYYPMSDHF